MKKKKLYTELEWDSLKKEGNIYDFSVYFFVTYDGYLSHEK